MVCDFNIIFNDCNCGVIRNTQHITKKMKFLAIVTVIAVVQYSSINSYSFVMTAIMEDISSYSIISFVIAAVLVIVIKL